MLRRWFKRESDVLVVDTAHGHSQGVLTKAKELRKQFPNVLLVIGNVATADATRACIDAGADAVKVELGQEASVQLRLWLVWVFHN